VGETDFAIRVPAREGVPGSAARVLSWKIPLPRDTRHPASPMYRILPLAAALALAAAPAAAAAQAQPSRCAGEVRCVTVSFRDTPIRDVAATFAEFGGVSIVLGSGATGEVTAEIRQQPWDLALRAILESQGLALRQVAPGLLRIDAAEALHQQAEAAPLVTRVFRLNYLPAAEAARTLDGLRSERGRVALSETTNSLVVTDTAERIATFARILGHAP
jgi:type II secretory pathway component HofQ